MATVKHTYKLTAKPCLNCKEIFIGSSIKKFCSANCRAEKYNKKLLNKNNH